MMAIMVKKSFRFLSICKALNVLSTKSDNIFLPIKNGEYDLIVDAKGVLSRIKVYTTKGDMVFLRRGMKKDLFRSSSCEFVFVDTPIGDYLIPSVEINQTTAITLSTCEKFLIKQPSDKGIDP